MVKPHLRKKKVKIYQGKRGGKYFILRGKKVYLSSRKTYD